VSQPPDNQHPWFNAGLLVYTALGFGFLAFAGWAFFTLLI
jgi:hypothetical protein